MGITQLLTGLRAIFGTPRTRQINPDSKRDPGLMIVSPLIDLVLRIEIPAHRPLQVQAIPFGNLPKTRQGEGRSDPRHTGGILAIRAIQTRQLRGAEVKHQPQVTAFRVLFIDHPLNTRGRTQGKASLPMSAILKSVFERQYHRLA